MSEVLISRGTVDSTSLRAPSADVLPPSPHPRRLEAESIYILREAVAEAANPAMLYSIGKDSSVMLHLARKAFYPATPPLPLLHVDTRWKFQEMYRFRDRMARECGMDLLVHINPECIARNINPFDHGSALHTKVAKTEGLKQAMDRHSFDVVFGGARRDEDKSRAKERVLSVHSATHSWDPKQQRPELWNLYSTRKAPSESNRATALSLNVCPYRAKSVLHRRPPRLIYGGDNDSDAGGLRCLLIRPVEVITLSWTYPGRCRKKLQTSQGRINSSSLRWHHRATGTTRKAYSRRPLMRRKPIWSARPSLWASPRRALIASRSTPSK